MPKPEDLLNNPFLQLLQQKHSRLYSRVQDLCWVVCVPATSSLVKPYVFDQAFIDHHVLRPSPLFQGVFEVHNEHECTAEIEGGVVRTSGFPQNRIANIVTTETFYNKKYEPFSVYLIDTPLFGAVASVSTAPLQPLEGSSMKMPSSKFFALGVQYLHSFAENEIVLRKMKEKMHKFVERYVILKGFEADARTKLAPLIEDSIDQLLCCNIDFRKMMDDETLLRELSLHIESFLVNELLLPSQLKEFYRDEDKALASRINLYRNANLPLDAFGVQTEFVGVSLSDPAEKMTAFKDISTPLEVAYLCHDVTVAITHSVETHMERMGFQSAPVTTDDLIPLIACVLMASPPSSCRYLESSLLLAEHFIFTDLSATQLNFDIVNFRVATSYLLSSEMPPLRPGSGSRGIFSADGDDADDVDFSLTEDLVSAAPRSHTTSFRLNGSFATHSNNSVAPMTLPAPTPVATASVTQPFFRRPSFKKKPATRKGTSPSLKAPRSTTSSSTTTSARKGYYQRPPSVISMTPPSSSPHNPPSSTSLLMTQSAPAPSSSPTPDSPSPPVPRNAPTYRDSSRPSNNPFGSSTTSSPPPSSSPTPHYASPTSSTFTPTTTTSSSSSSYNPFATEPPTQSMASASTTSQRPQGTNPFDSGWEADRKSKRASTTPTQSRSLLQSHSHSRTSASARSLTNNPFDSMLGEGIGASSSGASNNPFGAAPSSRSSTAARRAPSPQPSQSQYNSPPTFISGMDTSDLVLPKRQRKW